MNLLIKQLLWCWFTLHINFILFFWFCGDHGDCKYIQIHAWWVLSLISLIWKPLCSHRLILYVGGIKAILITQNLWHCSAPTQIWIQPLLLLFIVSESLASGLLVFVTSDRCSYCVNNGLLQIPTRRHSHACSTHTVLKPVNGRMMCFSQSTVRLQMRKWYLYCSLFLPPHMLM